MLIQTKGLIVRSVKYRETSLILDIYTREVGLRTYVINGVRKKNAKTSASLLQLMNLVELNAYENEQRDINRIREVRSAYLYKEIPFRIQKSAVGQFMLEMVRKSIREKEKNIRLYDFLESSFIYLDETQFSIANYHISFLLGFAAQLGFAPDSNHSEAKPFFDLREGQFVATAPYHRDYLSETESKGLSLFLENDFQDHHSIQLSKEKRARLLERIIDFYRIQTGDMGPIRSMDVFRELFN